MGTSSKSSSPIFMEETSINLVVSMGKWSRIHHRYLQRNQHQRNRVHGNSFVLLSPIVMEEININEFVSKRCLVVSSWCIISAVATADKVPIHLYGESANNGIVSTEISTEPVPCLLK
jgi:hypothetical protein